jgi:hypothetical protein
MAQTLCLLHVATGRRPPLAFTAAERFAAGMSAKPVANPDQAPEAKNTSALDGTGTIGD